MGLGKYIKEIYFDHQFNTFTFTCREIKDFEMLLQGRVLSDGLFKIRRDNDGTWIFYFKA